MQHILFLISKDSTTHGGAEEIMSLTANFFLRRGDDVHVFFLLEKKYGDWERLSYPNLHLYYSSGGGKFGIFSIIRNFIKVHRITFDYSFSSIVECTGLVALMKRVGVLKINNVIARESTMVFNRFKGFQLWQYKMMYKHCYPAVNTIICQTEWMREEVLKNQPGLEKKSKVVFIPNPVDFEKIERMESEVIDTESYKPYIVACGRLHPVKAYDLLIEAFACIVKERPELHLVILGEGTERARLTTKIEELGIQDRVYLLGEVPNVYPYFRQAEACTVTSHIEGFPNVLLQMMSQNDRVVSTTCAGGVDKIKGLITCKPSDVEALTDALRRGLTADVTGNRAFFDEELQLRSIEKFVKRAINSTE